MDLSAIFRKKYGSFRRFFLLLVKARLPFLWIALDLALSFGIINIGVNATEYSAKLYAGEVDFVSVVLPFLLVTLVSLLLGSISGLVTQVCSAFMSRNLRRMVWRKAVRLPLSFYEANTPKEMISRITNDATAITTLVMQVFLPIITGAYQAWVVLKKISTYDAALMWSLVAVLPINVLINFVMGRLNFGLSDLSNRRTAELTAALSEKTGNMMLVKTMGTEEKEMAAGVARMEASYKAGVLSNWVGQLAGPIHTIAGVLQTIVIIMVGRGFYSSGAISLPEWIAYYGFAAQLTNLFSAYLGYWTSFKSTQGATDRVSQIMDAPSEDARSGETVDQLHGDIRLEKVDFSYGETPLFQGLDLTIPAGRITAIVGPSGSGKSTLLNLIDRLYPLQGGTISIGGKNTADYSLASYRAALGYVTQECVMYAGTLRDNLTQGVDREPTEEELDEACTAAGIMEYVQSLPEKYDSLVGEGGASLSGGQRQRLTVASALLERPDYLLLDEATAAMDIDGKDRVWTSIRALMARKTVVFVAHDGQTVRNADYIIVLRDGKVEAAGARDVMLSSNAYCQEMLAKTKKSGEEEQ